MNPHEPLPTDDLRALIDQFVDDTLADEGMRELERALNQSATARSYFLEYFQLHIDIGADATVDKHAERAFGEFCARRQRVVTAATFGDTRHRERSRQSERQQSAGGGAWPSRGRRSMAVGWPAVVFCLGVLATTLGYELWIAPRRLAQVEAHEPVAPETPEGTNEIPAARLTYAYGCSWGGVREASRSIDSQVDLGDEVVLQEGIAEFRLSSGVFVSIEGPASLVVTSPTSLVLQHGTMTVYVPWTVADFQMAAGSCRLTACDAEFGVQVAGGDLRVHSFSNSVLVAAPFGGPRDPEQEGPAALQVEADLPPGAPFDRAMILEDRSLHLEGQADSLKVAGWGSADETQFATRLSMAGRLPISREYVEAVVAAKPIGYWRFEQLVDKRVRNEVGEQAPLEALGKIHLAGDDENRVLELGRPGDDGFLYCKNLIDLSQSDYSVEVWVKPSHVHTGGCVALLAEVPVATRERLAFYLQLCGNQLFWEPEIRGQFRFLHRSPPGHAHATGISCRLQTPYAVRRWQYLVATKRGAEMKLYVDGRQVDSQSDESALPPNLGIVVGQLTKPTNKGVFCGKMDELAIYSKALSEQEVRRHFEAVNWKEVEAPPPKGTSI